MENINSSKIIIEKELNKLDYLEIKKKTIESLNSGKEIEILIRRFGINGKKPETLESIGKTFGVTRERIRQIEKDILKKLDLSSELKEIFSLLEKKILENGGIITTLELERLLGINEADERIFLRILLESSSRVRKIETPLIKESWLLAKYSLNSVLNIATTAENILKEINKPLNPEKLINLISEKSGKSENSHSFINNVLLSAKKIGKTIKGDFGLMVWGIVNPKNTRDKAYIVLHQAQKPLHYQKLTELIKEADFSKKMVSVEAVHNELIRDSRFVLVGRGIYALKEWGYKAGTVSDVITEILKKEGKPLHKNEIIKKVLEKRIVRKNTILLNLQEKPQFKRVKRAVYTLRE